MGCLRRRMGMRLVGTKSKRLQKTLTLAPNSRCCLGLARSAQAHGHGLELIVELGHRRAYCWRALDHDA